MNIFLFSITLTGIKSNKKLKANEILFIKNTKFNHF